MSLLESHFRFVSISVLVTVCDDVRLMHAAVTVDDVAVASIDFPWEFDSLDDCDKLDTVNAETVDAELFVLLIMPLSASRMNDESRDVIAEFA